jgi:hypothetical protein
MIIPRIQRFDRRRRRFQIPGIDHRLSSVHSVDEIITVNRCMHVQGCVRVFVWVAKYEEKNTEKYIARLIDTHEMSLHAFAAGDCRPTD